jgi:transcriptional regulator with XRE-family HTH domain
MSEEKPGNLFEQLTRLTGQVAEQTIDAARTTAALASMFGESRIGSAVMKTLEPERLQAMADAGHFLRDARETAGLSLKELSESLGLSDDNLLEEVESGRRIVPIEVLFRMASLIARHDPIPFLIQFMRTYNPAWGATMEQWGMLAVPLQYERERRWINLYRQHDALRELSDEEYNRLLDYVDSATHLVLDVMSSEKAASQASAASTNATESSPAPRKRKPPRVDVEAVKKKVPSKKATAKSKAKTKAATKPKTGTQ